MAATSVPRKTTNLEDVSATAPAGGQAPVFDEGEGKYVPTDTVPVSTTDPADGQGLVFDGGTSRYVPTDTIPFSATSSPVDTYVVTWDAGLGKAKWAAAAGGGGSPGGTSQAVQYNSSSAFAGAANVRTDGTSLTVGASSLLTSRFGVIGDSAAAPAGYFAVSNAGLYGDGTWANSYGSFEVANRNQTDGNAAYFSFSGDATGGNSPAVLVCEFVSHTSHEGKLHVQTRDSGGTLAERATFDANGVSGAGSGLTALNASALASGTVNAARLPDLSATYSVKAGNTGLVTLGTVTTGTWHGTAIADSYIASAATWNAKGTGTVTSVGISLPSDLFIIGGSPVTTTGSLTVGVAYQSANRVWAGPTTGADTSPAFRSLVAADVPDLSATYSVKAGNTSLVTLGTVTDGTWHGTAVADAYIASAATWNAKGTGTVTTASVVSANGFAGSVANATTTPAVTITTTVTGIVKGNGTALSAASAGTDYLAPAGNGSALTGITQSQVSGLTTASSPTFAGLTVGSLAGLLKAASGVVSAAAAGTDYLSPSGSGAALSGVCLTANNLSDVTAATARTNLGLGTAATHATGDYLSSVLPVRIDSHYGIITADSDGSTVTFDLSVSDWHTVTLGGARTLALSNGTTGQQFTIVLVQDGTGSRTVTWFNTIKWPGGTVPTLTTTINKADVFTFKQTGAGAYYGFVAGQSL